MYIESKRDQSFDPYTYVIYNTSIIGAFMFFTE